MGYNMNLKKLKTLDCSVIMLWLHSIKFDWILPIINDYTKFVLTSRKLFPSTIYCKFDLLFVEKKNSEKKVNIKVA